MVVHPLYYVYCCVPGHFRSFKLVIWIESILTKLFSLYFIFIFIYLNKIETKTHTHKKYIQYQIVDQHLCEQNDMHSERMAMKIE